MAKKKLFSEIPHLGNGRITLGKITEEDAEALREPTVTDKWIR